MQFDLSHPAQVARWVANRIDGMWGQSFGPCTAIGGGIDGRVVAGCVYNNFARYGDGRNVVEISMAADDPKWCTQAAIAVFLSYPFLELKCGVAILRITKKNKRARRFVRGIGFVECGVVPRLYGTDDGVIYAMTREKAARWIGS